MEKIILVIIEIIEVHVTGTQQFIIINATMKNSNKYC